MSKQDRQGARTATDIERKYNFGKSFAEVMGIAEDARDAAEEAKNAASNPAEKLTHDEVFNLLTQNGTLQGLYRGGDGELYINAEYIKALEKLFAKDIFMTGKFESTVEAYLPPTYDDAVCLLWAAFYPEERPLPEGYDFDLNGDGKFDENDAIAAMNVYNGNLSMSSLPGAAKTTATLRINMSDPEKTIHIFGTNMWGTYVETFIGADVNNSSFASREYLKRMINQEPNKDYLYRTVDGEKEYFNPPMWLDTEYRTIERFDGSPVYTYCTSIAVDRIDTLVHDTGIGRWDVISIDARFVGDNGVVYPFPVYIDGQIVASAWTEKEGIVKVYIGSDVLDHQGTVYITVKYTK